jgi:hypothetical protein
MPEGRTTKVQLSVNRRPAKNKDQLHRNFAHA